MNSKSLKEEEIPDSTDWLPTPLSKLSSVESALRCQVCKEFFTTPMITSCSHTFCSLCIRRCLGNDGKCPACRAPDQEYKLRQNWAMEELTEAFTRARPDALKFARDAVAEESPKRKRDTEEEGESSPVKKRTRSSGRTAKLSSKVVVLDSKGDDDDYSPKDEEPDDGLAACPICEVRMTPRAVEEHLDVCLGVKPPKKQANASTQLHISSPSNPVSKPLNRPEKLARPHFDGMKDKPLRDKLLGFGISAGGSREAMMKRYLEWVLIWNSNCDSKEPKTKPELKKQLDVWEKSQGDRASTSTIAYSMGLQIKDKEFDGKAWSDQHSDSFGDLIAKARAKKMTPKDDPAGEKVEEKSSNLVDPAPPLPQPNGLENRSSGSTEEPRTPLPRIPDHNLPADSHVIHDSAQSHFFQDPPSHLTPSVQYQGMAQNIDPYAAPTSSQYHSPYQGLAHNLDKNLG